MQYSSVTAKNSHAIPLWAHPPPTWTPGDRWSILCHYSFVFLRISHKWNNTVCSFLSFASFKQHNAIHNWVLRTVFFLCYPAVKKIRCSKILWLQRKTAISHMNVESLNYSRNISMYLSVCSFKCDTMYWVSFPDTLHLMSLVKLSLSICSTL